MIDLRYETPFRSTGLCNAEPLERLWDQPVWAEQRLLVPGRPDYSTVYLRPSVRGIFRMPPLGSDVIDETSVALIGAWIEGISSCE